MMNHEEKIKTIELLARMGHEISPVASRDLIEHAVTRGVMLAIA
ncbi:hypothetical protein [Lonsdalea quercina]